MLNEGWEPDFSPAERQRLIDLYDDSIRHGDRFLSRLRHDLRDDDPVFVVHADHGEEFGEHGRYGHQPYLYENLIDVPLVVANAGERTRVERPVELRSLAPTIADLGGVPSALPGRSLLSDANADRPWAFSKVFADGDRRLAVRTEELKYVSDADGRELYDLRLDPDEQVDLAGDRADAVGAFDSLSDRHVAAERENRIISDRVADLPDGGRVL
jgi:arylsulfatase